MQNGTGYYMRSSHSELGLPVGELGEKLWFDPPVVRFARKFSFKPPRCIRCLFGITNLVLLLMNFPSFSISSNRYLVNELSRHHSDMSCKLCRRRYPADKDATKPQVAQAQNENAIELYDLRYKALYGKFTLVFNILK